MNCTGCGVDVEPSLEQVNDAVDQILQTSLKDAEKKAGVCPLCGHSMERPYSHRRSVQFALLFVILIIVTGIALTVYGSHHTARHDAAMEAVQRLNLNADLLQILGDPVTLAGKIQGEVRQDETGWTEADLMMPVRGPLGEGIARVIGGKGNGPWIFSTLEVEVAREHKTVNLVTGKVSVAEPGAYLDVHSEAAVAADHTLNTSPPRLPGTFPCVFAAPYGLESTPQLGQCSTPIPMMQSSPLDRMEVDLRYGHFILRETDFFLYDSFNVPLTRTYNSGDWIHPNRLHAFGNNSNHPYDIAPLGSRNPYTFQMIALEDSEFLYFDRISKGTGYADAVFQQTETAGGFYQAIQKWNGNGWTTKLSDGSQIVFPESYNATNMAQGAPTEMIDAQGNELKLVRDPRRNLLEIRTPSGHFIRFAYDDLSRIIRADDDQGHSAQYVYNADGMLSDVFLPWGRERHYGYAGSLMTWIKDEQGSTVVHNWYREGKVERQDFANGQSYYYRYQTAPRTGYAESATVTLPDGIVKELMLTQFLPQYIKGSRGQ